MHLETSRLILRPWQESDAEELYKYAKDPAVGPVAGWPVHKSLEDSRRVIKTIFAAPETYAVVLKQTGKPVGCVSLKIGKQSKIGIPDDECEIGCWIGVPYWGQGLIPEAVRRLQKRAFEELGMAKIWYGYYDGNTKSKRVQEKCGFSYRFTIKCESPQLVGEVKTEHIACLTKEEYSLSMNF